MLRKKLNRQAGSAMTAVLASAVVLGGVSAMMLQSVTTTKGQHSEARNQLFRMEIADAGLNQALASLRAGGTGVFGSQVAPVAFGGGSFWTTVTGGPGGNDIVRSNGTYAGRTQPVEVLFESSHVLRDYAVYVGNKSNAANTQLDLSGIGTSGDIVNGKIHNNGSIHLAENSAVNGDASASEDITGNAINGQSYDHVDPIEPPDLSLMSYDTTSDFVIDSASPWDASGEIAESDPRHIFVKDFRTDLAPAAGFVFENTNYFLGDPYEGASISRISVDSSGNHKTYFVDGNLWIEPNGPTSSLINSPADGTVITIIVRGNIYYSDTFEYDNVAKDGVLFIAMSDGESYTDLDGDNQYDVGEPILHDDGDGIYQGVAEGSGNVMFGDPNGGPLGHIYGFVYAENHFEDHVLSGSNGEALPFEVTGFLSAGEQFRVNRDLGADHAQFKVNYDSRLIDGSLSQPGFPESGTSNSSEGSGVLFWRMLGQF